MTWIAHYFCGTSLIMASTVTHNIAGLMPDDHRPLNPQVNEQHELPVHKVVPIHFGIVIGGPLELQFHLGFYGRNW